MESNITTILVAIFASTGFWTVINTIIQNHKDKKKNNEKDNKVIKEALLALLHDALYDKCTTVLEIGAISPDDYENIETMIKPYEQLGGNGTIHKLWAEVDKLPTFQGGQENEN